ncbi:hypothetical protein EI94DRAFT_71240 [Lactarius quietus]|nr:hypothetical protein EI94DRAFT_71240 [Lactarius quietus]
MMRHPWLIIPILFFSPSYTAAYTWQLTSEPSQCQTVSVAVQGSECRSSQLRTIQNISFTGSSTLSFNLNYAADSFFVEIVYLYFKSATAVVVALVVLVSQLMSFHHPTPVVIITPRASNSPGCITSIPRRYLTARIGSVVVGSNFKVHSCSS